MARWLIVLALAIPLLALADGKKKSKPDVEIWPPPAPDTDQAGNTKPKPKPEPKPEDVPDAGGHFELDPELRGDPMAGTKPDPDPAAASGDDDDDACDDAFDSCKEDCAVEHATDDTLHVAKGKKLPVQKCLGRCESKRDNCEEQHEAGFKGKDE